MRRRSPRFLLPLGAAIAVVVATHVPVARAASVDEKSLNLAMASDIGAQLAGAGLDVIFTRTSDVFVPLRSRTALANSRHADLFVSMHNNSGNARGSWSEVYHQVGSESAHRAADEIAAGIKAAFGGQRDARVYGRANAKTTDYYFVLRNTAMPAAIVEGGFLSNRAEARRLAGSPEFRAALVRGVVAGVLAYQATLVAAPTPVLDPGHRVETTLGPPTNLATLVPAVRDRPRLGRRPNSAGVPRLPRRVTDRGAGEPGVGPGALRAGTARVHRPLRRARPELPLRGAGRDRRSG